MEPYKFTEVKIIDEKEFLISRLTEHLITQIKLENDNKEKNAALKERDHEVEKMRAAIKERDEKDKS